MSYEIYKSIKQLPNGDFDCVCASSNVFPKYWSHHIMTFFSKEFPTANNNEIENNPTENGMDILTAVSATSETPRATKIPSTIVYKENTHCAIIDGMINFKKSVFSDLPSNCIKQKPLLSYASFSD